MEYLGAKYTKTKKYEKTKNLMCDININTLFDDMPNIFKFIYKNISFLDFEESPPYEYFITLLEKEKFKIKENGKSSEEYKFAWTEKIINILEKKNNKSILYKIKTFTKK